MVSVVWPSYLTLPLNVIGAGAFAVLGTRLDSNPLVVMLATYGWASACLALTYWIFRQLITPAVLEHWRLLKRQRVTGYDPPGVKR